MKTTFAVLALSMITVSGAFAQTQEPNGNNGTNIETPDRINPFKWNFLLDIPVKDEDDSKKIHVNNSKPMATKPARAKLRVKK